MVMLHDALGKVTSNRYIAQCKRCFMTGKACIYQREIAQELKGVTPAVARRRQAFMLMPFNSTLDEVYRAQLEPCLKHIDDLDVQRADDVARTGYVICEKICKQIQLSDVVCAEVSCDNPNVFYELGLARALDRHIALFMQTSVKGQRSGLDTMLGLALEQVNTYDPFDMLTHTTLKLWHQSRGSAPATPRNEKVVILLADTWGFSESVNGQKLTYTVDGLCKGAIHRTLDTLQTEGISPWKPEDRRTIVLSGNSYLEDKKSITFRDVLKAVYDASYVIVVTHRDQPCSYFWLGYAHGLEKDVIPITVSKGQEIPIAGDDGTRSVVADDLRDLKWGAAGDGLPFDMRALWHITFPYNKPIDLEQQLTGILKIVAGRNQDKLHRARFWQPFLEEGSVSIFVGSVELTSNQRHVIGEWDYRTVAELTSSFASTKETMEISIEAPTFQTSSKPSFTGSIRDDYAKDLLKKLTSGNCIVLASADVNDMTEVALATYARVDPFHAKNWRNATFNGVVGFKSKGEAAFETPAVYFQNMDRDRSEGKRGFMDIAGGGPHKDRTWSAVYHPYSEKTTDGFAVYHAHVAKFRLPRSNHWTVVLQGITGPATLGLAQALTGGTNEQFTIFTAAISQEERTKILTEVRKDSGTLAEAMDDSTMSPEGTVSSLDFQAHAEKLAALLNRASTAEANIDSVEAVVRVYVMDGADEQHDERKIIWWDWDRELAPRRMPHGGSPAVP